MLHTLKDNMCVSAPLQALFMLDTTQQHILHSQLAQVLSQQHCSSHQQHMRQPLLIASSAPATPAGNQRPIPMPANLEPQT
jgi:hypothetical protein